MSSSRAGRRTRRKAPSPNSILDRKALLQALDDRGLAIKPIHIELFYQLLHRQHYPELPQFVETYLKNEQQRQHQQLEPSLHDDETRMTPLRNKISHRKNKNRSGGLPKKFLEFLRDSNSGFVTLTSKVAEQKTSADETTTKLAVQLHDGQLVESVLMRYVSPDGSRASLCISSQCGCAMGCTFCATGTMGLSGNLASSEILEQIIHADRILAHEWKEKQGENNALRANLQSSEPLKHDFVRNVVFMGMGEPLDNYENVLEACRALIDRKRWSLAHGKVTVSTVGIISKIRKLTIDLPEVSLALSLHAPNQEMRSAIVPTAKHYPIEELIDALDGHMMAYMKKRVPPGTEYSPEQRIKESSRRRAMIEYVMLEGPTSSIECAHQLGKLCEGRKLVVNLIPYNQTDVRDKLKCPSEEHMLEFKNIVASYGAFCTIRRTMGADIDSACGQLISLKNKQKESAAGQVGDIEDMGMKVNSERAAVSTKTAAKAKNLGTSDSVIETPDLDRWVKPLAAATLLAASCFVASSYMFVKQRRR